VAIEQTILNSILLMVVLIALFCVLGLPRGSERG
jgi:hypothetical protein